MKYSKRLWSILFGTPLLPSVFKCFERRQSNKFELECMRVQQENALALGNQKLDMVAIDAQAREVEAIHREYAKITVKASQFWINFSSSCRPMLTYLIFLEFMTPMVMLAAGWIDEQHYSLIWDVPMQGIIAALSCYWYGQRNFSAK